MAVVGAKNELQQFIAFARPRSDTVWPGLTARNGGCHTSDPDKAPWVAGMVAITGLDAADEQLLSDWLTRAKAGRIDYIVDFADRSWQVDGLGAIMGVFEAREDLASWLIVRSCDGWQLISCAGNFVSDVSIHLPQILRLIDAY